MRRTALFALLGVVTALAGGCSREEGLRCQDDSGYASATSIPPIRVPDDLTVPDESEALLIPEVPSTAEEPSPDRCLESPPDYFEEEA